MKLQFGNTWLGGGSSTYNMELDETWETKFHYNTRRRIDYFIDKGRRPSSMYTINFLHKIQYVVEFEVTKKQYDEYLISFPPFTTDDDMDWVKLLK